MKTYRFSSSKNNTDISFLEKRNIFFAAPSPAPALTPTPIDPITNVTSINSSVDFLAQSEEFQYLRNHKDSVIWRVHNGKLTVVVNQTVILSGQASSPPGPSVANTKYLNDVSGVVAKFNNQLGLVTNTEIHAALYLRTSTERDLKRYLDVFGKLTPNKKIDNVDTVMTPESIRLLYAKHINFKNNPAPGSNPQEELYLKQLFEYTPLGILIEKNGPSVITESVLSGLNKTFESRHHSGGDRLNKLKGVMGTNSVLDSVEDLPWFMQVGGALVLAFWAAKHKNIAAGIVMADIVTRMSVNEDGLILGVIPDAIKSVTEPVAREVRDSVSSELQGVYSQVTPSAKRKCLALSVALDKPVMSITKDIEDQVGKNPTEESLKDLQNSKESSLWDASLENIKSPDLKDLKWQFQVQGIGPFHYNQGIYDVLVFLGDGSALSGYKALQKNTFEYKSLADLVWAKTQETMRQDNVATMRESAEQFLSSSIKNLPAGMKGLFGDGKDLLKEGWTIAKEGGNYILGLPDKIAKEFPSLEPVIKVLGDPLKGFSFEATVNFATDILNEGVDIAGGIVGGVKKITFSALEPMIEYLGYAEKINIDQNTPYKSAAVMQSNNPGQNVWHSAVSMSDGTENYIEYQQFSQDTRSRIEAIKRDKSFFEVIDNMTGFIEEIDENHALALGGTFMQPDVWNWALEGDSGSVQENNWTQLLRLKARELLMIYGHKLENKGTETADEITKDFKENYLDKFSEYLEKWKTVAAKSGADTTQEILNWNEYFDEDDPSSSLVKVYLVGWIANSWDNTFGSVDGEEASDLVGKLAQLKAKQDGKKGYPSILDVTEVSEDNKSKIGHLVSSTYADLMTGNDWKDVQGRNQSKVGASYRGYAVSKYMTLVASINKAEDSRFPNITHQDYLNKLRDQFLTVSDYSDNEAITKEVIDKLFLDTKTYTEYAAGGNSSNSVKRNIKDVRSTVNPALESNEIASSIIDIVKNKIGSTSSGPFDQSELNTKVTDFEQKILNDVKAAGKNFARFSEVETYLRENGYILSIGSSEADAGKKNMKIELLEVLNNVPETLNTTIYAGNYGKATPSVALKNAFSVINNADENVIHVKTIEKNYTNPASVQSFGMHLGDDTIVYSETIKSTVNPSNESAKIADVANEIAITTANELGHEIFKKLYQNLSGKDLDAVESNKTFAYPSVTYTVHQINESFSDLHSLHKAKSLGLAVFKKELKDSISRTDQSGVSKNIGYAFSSKTLAYAMKQAGIVQNNINSLDDTKAKGFLTHLEGIIFNNLNKVNGITL